MGGGGLRIIPHKTWNVYGYEQRKKVEEDERREKKRLAKLGDENARKNVKNALKQLNKNSDGGTSISQSSSPERETAKDHKKWVKKSKADEEKLKYEHGKEFNFGKMLKRRMTPWYQQDKKGDWRDQKKKVDTSSSEEELGSHENFKMAKILKALKEKKKEKKAKKERKKSKKKKEKKSKKKSKKKSHRSDRERSRNRDKIDKKLKIGEKSSKMEELRKKKYAREKREKKREAELLKSIKH